MLSVESGEGVRGPELPSTIGADVERTSVGGSDGSRSLGLPTAVAVDAALRIAALIPYGEEGDDRPLRRPGDCSLLRRPGVGER